MHVDQASSVDIKISNEELALLISSLELAARIMPEADIKDLHLLSEKVTAVDSLCRRLTRVALSRGLT